MSNYNPLNHLLANLNTTPPYSAAMIPATPTRPATEEDETLQRELNLWKSVDFSDLNTLSQKSSMSSGGQGTRYPQRSAPTTTEGNTEASRLAPCDTSSTQSPTTASEADVLRSLLGLATGRAIDTTTLSALLLQQQQHQQQHQHHYFSAASMAHPSSGNISSTEATLNLFQTLNPLTAAHLTSPSPPMPTPHLPTVQSPLLSGTPAITPSSSSSPSAVTNSPAIPLAATNTMTMGGGGGRNQTKSSTNNANDARKTASVRRRTKSPESIESSATMEGEIGGPEAGSSETSEDRRKNFELEEDKRRRNTAASARFRMKKKMREQQLEKTAQEMTDRANVLEQRVRELEMENRWLRNLVVEKDPGLLGNGKGKRTRSTKTDTKNSAGSGSRKRTQAAETDSDADACDEKVSD